MIVPVNIYSHETRGASGNPASTGGAYALGRNLYLVFVVSWFLHLAARVPALGAARIDLILVAVLTALAFASRSSERTPATTMDKILRVLFLYVILTIPFVEWPGSVIRSGIPEFIKAVVFYYFTIAFVRSEADLKKFVTVFLICQLYRVLEPLVLHVTLAYWGSAASLGNEEFMLRLSGSPWDVVNPNGLAAIICTVLPFLYFLSTLSWFNSLAFLTFVPVGLYALALTGSRSGFLALIVIIATIVVKAKHRFLVGAAGVLVLIGGFQFLSAEQQDRYLSAFGVGEKNVATAEQRWDNLESDLDVGLRRPIFGHGIGTSQEANANFGGRDQPSHNLYLEVLQELGFAGLAIFLPFLVSILVAIAELNRTFAAADAGRFLSRLVDALQVWLWMNLLFSLASYGLSDYEWYLLGGMALVIRRLAATPSPARP